MAVNLAEKYSKNIAEKYRLSSVIQGQVSNAYTWDGVKAINVLTPVSQTPGDYNRNASGNRFGETKELQDYAQYMPLTMDKSFSIAIDKANNMDQEGLKAGALMMKMEIDEEMVPMTDMHALKVFGNCAGNRVKIDEPTEDTVVKQLFTGATALDNGKAPYDNRVCFMRSSVYNNLRLSKQFVGVDSLGERALAKGVVGEAADMRIIKVPDFYLPDCYFICAHKAAILAPTKIKTARVNNEPQGIDGVLLEGRYYFDAFVLGAKAEGVYAAVAGNIVELPVVSASGAVTAVDGVTFYYTLDGSDPRFSKSARLMNSAVTPGAGEVLKVAGKNDAGAWSGITTK